MTLSRRSMLEGAAILVASRTAQAETPVDAVVARVAAARARLRTLQGPFTQTRTIGLLATEVRSKGTLTLVVPDRLRWDLAPPDDVTFWMGPEGLAYKSAHGSGRMPTTSATVAAALDDVRDFMGGDLARMRQRWDFQVLRDDANGVEVEARPRDASRGLLRSMRFALAGDLVRPTHALLVEGPRDKTSIEFGSLTVNGAVEEARMRPPQT